MLAYLNLREVLERENVTQADLAALLGVHRNTIEGKINGTIKSGFYIDEAFKIRDTLFRKYNLEWLFARNEKNAPPRR